VYNALAVLALGDAWELDPEAVQQGLRGVDRVPGRMERSTSGSRSRLSSTMPTARPRSVPSWTCLRRAPPLAGAASSRCSVRRANGIGGSVRRWGASRVSACRLVVVTDEDPRGEDRERILDEIAQGAERAGRRRGHDLLLIADRRAAIEAAFEAARPSDVVLLAGKGHERSIIGPDGALPWDEAAVARDVLTTMGHAAPR
jgi:UDP-N-acetylmuramyl tripeptide synthase